MDPIMQSRVETLKSDLLNAGLNDDYNTTVAVETDYNKKLKNVALYDAFLADLTSILNSPQTRERILSVIGNKITVLNGALVTLRS